MMVGLQQETSGLAESLRADDVIVAKPALKRAADVNVFYSSAVEGEISSILGQTHYSYRFAEKKFLDLFHSEGIHPVKLEMPEYYASSAALIGKVKDPFLPAIHLIFRSTEQIRLLKFGYNICCFAWEFDHLSSLTRHEEHPFRNQVRMLSLCQEVWVPSSYTESVLKRHNLTSVERVPAPVDRLSNKVMSLNGALAILADLPVVPLIVNAVTPRRSRPNIAAARETTFLDWIVERRREQGKLDVYLSILNPQDHRKNVDSLLRAFTYFLTESPSAVVILKLVTSGSRFSLEEAATNLIFEELQGGSYLRSDRLVFTSDYLTEPQMAALYNAADFYVSASLAEGQNLPLQEAMAHGVVALSTCHTAMLDYVRSDNAVIISSSRNRAEDQGLAGHVDGEELFVERSDVSDILNALRLASRLDDNQRSLIARRGAASIASKYSRDCIWATVRNRIKEHANYMDQPK